MGGPVGTGDWGAPPGQGPCLLSGMRRANPTIPCPSPGCRLHNLHALCPRPRPPHADPLQQAAQQRLAAAAVGRTSTVPDTSSGAPSTSGRALGFPGGAAFPGSGASGDPFGQLAGALTGLAMAPLSALGVASGGGGPGVGLLSTQSVDLEDSRTREALRWVGGRVQRVSVCAGAGTPGRSAASAADAWLQACMCPLGRALNAHAVALPQAARAPLAAPPHRCAPPAPPPLWCSFLLSPEGVWIREFLLEVGKRCPAWSIALGAIQGSAGHTVPQLLAGWPTIRSPCWPPLPHPRCCPAPPPPFPQSPLQDLVKSIDALSRDQLRALLVRLGLQNLAVPVVVPGANR